MALVSNSDFSAVLGNRELQMQTCQRPDMAKGQPRRVAGRSLARPFTSCLLLALFFTNSEAAADWPYVVRYGNFVVHSDFDVTNLGGLFSEIAAVQSDLQQTLGLGAPREHVDVYLFANEPTYRAYMRQYFPQVVPRKAMFVKANSPGNVFAFSGPDLATDLRHECTHAALHACLPMVPLWLDEGLAEYFEVPASMRATDNPKIGTVRRNTYWRRPPSIEALESLRSLEQMGEPEYRDAWAWVHFMLHGPPPASAQLREFLQQIAQHTPPTALSERMRGSFPDITHSFVQHFRRWHR